MDSEDAKPGENAFSRLLYGWLEKGRNRYWRRMQNPNLDAVGQSHPSVLVLSRRWAYYNWDRDRRTLSRSLSGDQTDYLK